MESGCASLRGAGTNPNLAEPGQLPRGGFLHTQTQFIRTECPRHVQRIKDADAESLAPVLQGLNTLQVAIG